MYIVIANTNLRYSRFGLRILEWISERVVNNREKVKILNISTIDFIIDLFLVFRHD